MFKKYFIRYPFIFTFLLLTVIYFTIRFVIKKLNPIPTKKGITSIFQKFKFKRSEILSNA